MARVVITYFTDPYCSWCWATEPMLYRLRETYRDQVQIRYVMGGLVRDMADFYDSLNDIRTTAEVAPHWRMVSERSGQPIDERLMEDITDPHFSTWPACIAVKAAQLQGDTVGEAYLRRLRRAALTERRIISRPEVYRELAQQVRGLDIARFEQSLADGSAERAFQDDLATCRRYGVTGFPTLLFSAAETVRVPGSEQPVLVVGHRTFATYRQVLRHIAPHLEEHSPRQPVAMLAEYGPLTTRELAEVLGQTLQEVGEQMRILAAQGLVEAVEVRGGEFWRLAASGS
jgi:putative protein-disulfide isomerase